VIGAEHGKLTSGNLTSPSVDMLDARKDFDLSELGLQIQLSLKPTPRSFQCCSISMMTMNGKVEFEYRDEMRWAQVQTSSSGQSLRKPTRPSEHLSSVAPSGFDSESSLLLLLLNNPHPQQQPLLRLPSRFLTVVVDTDLRYTLVLSQPLGDTLSTI
jgi:hypothetical protein